MNNNKLISLIRNDFHDMEQEKASFLPLYDKVRKLVFPYGNGLDFEHDAETYNTIIYDGAPIAAANKLIQGLFSWVCSPAIDWLKVYPAGNGRRYIPKAVYEYCQEIEDYIMTVFRKYFVYSAIQMAIRNAVAFGTSCVFIDDTIDGLAVHNLHIREIFTSENNRGECDVLIRSFELTGRQILEAYDDVSEAVHKQCSESPQKRFKVMHAVYPIGYFLQIDEEIAKLLKMRNKKFVSVHLFCNNSGEPHEVIKTAGYDYKPFIVWRMVKSSTSPYGLTPLFDALQDIEILNLEAKTLMESEQLAARPPLFADDMLNGKLKIFPGGITYGSGDMMPRPIYTGSSLQANIDAINRRTAVIREHLKTDFFLTISQIQQGSRDRTATEIMELKAESAAVMGTIINNIEDEFLHPLIRTITTIEQSYNRMPKFVGDTNEKLQIELAGPLMQAQRKYLVKQGIEQGLARAAEMAQMFQDPLILENFDKDYAVRKLAEINGYPGEGLKTEQEVTQIKADFQKKQAMAEQLQFNAEAAKANAANAQAQMVQGGAYGGK